MVPVSEISRRLSDRCEEVCRLLLPGGRQERNFWLVGDVGGSAGRSLNVTLAGAYAGKWRDWAGGKDGDEKGDLLDLWRVTRGLAPADAVREAKEWLGIHEPELENKRASYSLPASNGTKPLNFEGRAGKYLTETRGLSAAILERFKVQIAPEKAAIVFPCHNPKGELINRSYRTLPKEGEKKKVWQDTGCAPCLFGWHAVSESAYLARTIILTEGQIDAMTWAQWGFDALSIPNGSGQSWIDYEWDNLAAFDRIYLAFDTDEAGKANAAKANLRLGRHRCFFVSVAGKDANDCLMAGATEAEAREWLDRAQTPAFSGLVRGGDMLKRLISEITPKPEAFTLPFLKVHWPDSGIYFRPAEVTLWTGFTSAGKSTFLNYLLAGAMCQRQGVFIASMESKVETVLRRLMRTGIPPSAPVNPELAEAFLTEFGKYMTFADVVGYIKREDLLEMMRFAFHRYGANHFLIDSLMRVEGLEEDYPAQGEFMNRLQEFAKQTDTHIHLVAHPRKNAAGNGRPDALSIKGSSLLANNADNIVSVNRNAAKDKLRKENKLEPKDAANMFDAEIVVEKQRESGWVGNYLLRFDPLRYAYSKMSP